MNIIARYIALAALFLFVAPVSFAVLPNVTAEGKSFPTLAPMLKRANPAVVNISTFSQLETRTNPLLNDPFFRRFFDLPDPDSREQPPRRRQQSAGSGVIVDAAEGIVMTNNHVIARADEVHVSLVDGRRIKAEVIGTDPQLDIAILRIDADELTELPFADSSRLEVGDFVVAIGNPFGLGQTVTTGIVSALGRSGLGIEGYENFIQTDASINPGNSGGALVNLGGELVGINTAIISPAGGNVGIGFAIPSNMARAIMRQIIDHGRVRRGQIGVGIQDISAELREAFELEKGQFGVLVSEVFEDSPAQQAGIRSGDIIVAVDGEETRSSAQLRSRVGIRAIDDTVELSIIRDGKLITARVKIGEPQTRVAHSEDLPQLLSGLSIDDDPSGEGVRVVDIDPDSPAAYSGLRPGDVIVGANKLRVTDTESFVAALKRSSESILLQIERDGTSFFLVIR